MSAPPGPAAPSLRDLRALTQARIALGAHGAGLPTGAALAFGLDHARAREAVWTPLDTAAIREALRAQSLEAFEVRSNVADRAEYLRRPDKGRTLDPASDAALAGLGQGFDVAIVIADGLSATAVTLNAVPAAAALAARVRRAGWSLAPVIVASQGRVAIGDHVGARLGARCVVVLIGERPGLSAPDSLGAYLTFAPAIGRSGADRNCVSNIHRKGLGYDEAAYRIAWLVRAGLERRITGVALKDESGDGRSHLGNPEGPTV
jgi:ethanolamine ammonia-lyase small subunit